MESRSWSLRLALVLAVASALWAAAATVSEHALRAAGAHRIASARVASSPAAPGVAAR